MTQFLKKYYHLVLPAVCILAVAAASIAAWLLTEPATSLPAPDDSIQPQPIQHLLSFMPLIIGAILCIPDFFCTTPLRKHSLSFNSLLSIIIAIMLGALTLSERTIVITTNFFFIAVLIGMLTKIITNYKLHNNISVFSRNSAAYTLIPFFIIYFCTIAVSYFWSDNKDYASLIIRRCLVIAAMPLAFSTINISKTQWEYIMLFFFRSSLAFTMISVVCWFSSAKYLNVDCTSFLLPYKHTIASRSSWEWIYRWTDYWHPSYHAWVLGAVIPGAITLLKRKIIGYPEYILYLALVALLVILTQSRIGVLIFATALLLSPFAWLNHNKKLRLTYAIVLIIAAIGLITFALCTENTFSLDSARQNIYRSALNVLKHNLWIGVGVGDLPLALQSPPHQHPHNQFLCDWMQAGIPAIAAELTMIIAVTARALKQHNLTLLIFIAISLLFMLIESPLTLIKGIAVFTTITLFFATQTQHYSRK